MLFGSAIFLGFAVVLGIASAQPAQDVRIMVPPPNLRNAFSTITQEENSDVIALFAGGEARYGKSCDDPVSGSLPLSQFIEVLHTAHNT